jgi:carbon-monoxide dehydrogenase large subunit
MEHVHYDPETGQLLAGSFMDYAMPRACDLPFYATALSEVPSTTHPLGIRPAGEGGTVPALAVIINAIVDALSDFGVRHIEMPATPERVWQAIAEAKRKGPENGVDLPRRPAVLGSDIASGGKNGGLSEA